MVKSAVVSGVSVTVALSIVTACSSEPSSIGGPTSATTAVSKGTVLATGAQLELEEQVRKILATDVMRSQIDQVAQLYRADPQAAHPAGAATVDSSAKAIGAAAAQYAVTGDPDRPAFMWTVAPSHRFADKPMPASGYGIENPDNVYRQSAISGDSAYEIRGRLGKGGPLELHLEFRDAIPGTTSFTAEGGGIVGSISSENLQTTDDGDFVITVDSRPADGRPNHIRIPPGKTSRALARDLIDDWSSQGPAPLEIRRISGPPAAPQRDTDTLAARSAEILSQIAPFWVKYFNTYYYSQEPNTIRAVRERPGGRGVSTGGWFRLRDDQALTFTVDPLGARSLGVQLSDPWGAAYEYRRRTSSLNTSQATPNPDGTYTFVISEKDPGIDNWLDPDGHGSGMIALRWQSFPAERSKPLDRALRDVAVVDVADLASTRDSGAATVSPSERDTQRSQRQAAFDRRMTATR